MKSVSMPCPECGFEISFTLEVLLSGNSLNCPSCLTKFKIDSKQSTNAMEQLHLLKNQELKQRKK